MTVSHTAVATVAAIEMAGATPLLIDIDPDHYTMDPARTGRRCWTHPPAGLPPIRAVIPVHLYGQAGGPGPRSSPLCRQHGVALIEDCAQAHGATLHGTAGSARSATRRRSASIPTKNLGALGDGGAVATDDPALAARIAALRQYGWQQHYISDEVGVNSRLDELQAAILRVKLRHLDARQRPPPGDRRGYDAALAGRADRAARRRDDGDHVYHQYVLRAPDRAAFRRGCGSGGSAPASTTRCPVHPQPAYRGRVALGPAACRASERARGRGAQPADLPGADRRSGCVHRECDRERPEAEEPMTTILSE